MFFKQVPVGNMQNFSYIIADEETKTAAVVDPAFDEDKLYDICDKNGIEIKMILLTHTHGDHTEAVGRIVKRTGAVVYVHKNEKSGMENIASNVSAVDEGDIIRIGNVEIEVLHTPGHTTGGVTYKTGNKLLTGDTLFIEGCGRTDLTGGNTEILYKTLQRIKSMPDIMEIYPGHDYGSIPHSTIAREKENNPYLKCRTLEKFTFLRDK